MAPPSWIRRRIDLIINNMILRVKNFNLYYEVIGFSYYQISIEFLHYHFRAQQ